MTKLNIPKISIITVTYNAGIMLEKPLTASRNSNMATKKPSWLTENQPTIV